MKKILLACAGGMSTGFIVKKMEQAALKLGQEVEIKAVGSLEVPSIWSSWDVLLIAPQVRFEAERFTKLVDGKIPVGLIPQQMYGMMDGAKILNLANDLLNE